MSFWFPRLRRLHKLLANWYPEQESTYLLVDAVGLPRDKIKFSSRASDNWYNILTEAKKSGKLTKFLEYVKTDSEDPEIAKAVDDYLKTSDPIEGGGGPGPLLGHWRKIIAGVVGIFLLLIGALAIFILLIPKPIRGYISCSDSSLYPGRRLEAATVIVEGRNESAITDDKGFFEIKVPRFARVKALEVLYGLGRYPAPVVSLEGTDFKVVPCQGEKPPVYKNIPLKWWEPTDMKDSALDSCHPTDKDSIARLYTLRPPTLIQKTEPGSKLFVTLVTRNPWTIVDAIVTLPIGVPDPPYAEMQREPQAYKWSIDMPGNELEIGIQACLESPANAPAPTNITLISTYYTQ